MRLTPLLLMALAITTAGCNRGGYTNNNDYYYYEQPQQQNYCEQHDVVDETYVHKYGVTVPQEDWQSRGKHGQVISTLKTGVVVTKNYVSGQLQGDTTYTFPHSQSVEHVETYSNGKLTQTLYNYKSGSPHKKVELKGHDGKVETTWYENGVPKSTEHFTGDLLVEGEYFTTNHQLESRINNGFGNRVSRDQYGQLLSYDTFENGQLTQQETYHQNGTPQEIATFKNGQKHGTRRTFTPSGEPVAIEEWQNGSQHGKTTQFENGEKVSEIAYANGMKHGTEHRYSEGNHVVEQIGWKEDKKHGPSESYIGNNVKTDWYFQGKKVSKFNYDQLTQWKSNQ